LRYSGTQAADGGTYYYDGTNSYHLFFGTASITF
jgi:hypothetical protein